MCLSHESYVDKRLLIKYIIKIKNLMKTNIFSINVWINQNTVNVTSAAMNASIFSDKLLKF